MPEPHRIPLQAAGSGVADAARRSLSRRGFLHLTGGAAAGALAVPLLGACAGGSGSADSGKVAGTLTFWDMVWGGSAYQATAQKIVTQYEKTHPGTKVDYRIIPWATFYEVFSSAIASGMTPDISTGATYQGFQYETALDDVDQLVAGWKRDGTDGQLVPGSLSAQQDAQGHYTGLPWCVDVRALTYRKDMFAKAGVPLPTSLGEIREAARKLTGRGTYGMGFSGDILGSQMLEALFFANGGGLFDDAGKPNLTSARNREVCAWVQDLVRDGSVPPPAAGWTTTDITTAMTKGEIAMAYNEPRWYAGLGSVADQAAILKPPTGFHGDKGTILWYSAIWQYKTASNATLAGNFMEWWLAHQESLWTVGQASPLPVRKPFYTSSPILEDPRVKVVTDEWIPVGKILSAPAAHALPVLNKVEGQAFMPTLAQDILRLRPVEDSLAKAQSGLQQAMTSV